METRKLQVSGHSTYILSLPKTWVRENDIKKGDRVRLRLQPDGTILLTPSILEKQRNRITVSVKESGDYLYRKFMGMYLAGYQIMTFDFMREIEPSEKRQLRKIVQKISGLEILEEGDTTITVHDLFDPTLFSPEKAIRRMHLLSKSMLSDAIDSFFNKDSGLAGEVLNRDEDVDLLNWLLARQYNLILQDISLSENLGISPQRGLGYLMLARSLERIGDHASKIASMEDLHKDEEDPLHGDIKMLSEKLIDSIEKAVSSFFFKDFNTANDILNSVEGLQDELRDLIGEGIMKGSEDIEVSLSHAFVLDSLKRISAYTIDIAEASINNQFVEDDI